MVTFRLRNFFIIFTLFALFGASSHASDQALVIKDKKHHYVLGKYLDILEDETGKLKITDIVKDNWQKKFKNRKGEKLNFGYSNSTFWARIKIKNKSKEQKVWLLSHHYYLQDEIELYREVTPPGHLGRGQSCFKH